MVLTRKNFHSTTVVQHFICGRRNLFCMTILLYICIVFVLIPATKSGKEESSRDIVEQSIAAATATATATATAAAADDDDDDLSKNVPKNNRIQKQIQLSHTTAMNRYPDEYAAVKEYVEEHMASKPNMKFLSFGSATGLEAISLASLYFYHSKHSDINIYGVDLDQKTLDEAKENVAKQNPPILEPKISFFNGNDADIDDYGKYDVIFANSVLCFHGRGKIPAKAITKHFSFDDFEATLTDLDASLREGGLFAMVNSNYYFEDSVVAKRYKRVANCTGNFVPKVDRVKNILVENPDNKALDCVWMKESSK